MSWTSKRFFGAAVMIALASGGCGGNGPDLPLAPVRGVVKLDGAPLPNAMVEFNPKEHVLPKSKKEIARGSSVAMTDKDGNYTLQFNNQLEGAVIGPHTVRVTPVLDPDAQLAKSAADKKKDVMALLKIQMTQLSYDVKAGENTYDIELRTR